MRIVEGRSDALPFVLLNQAIVFWRYLNLQKAPFHARNPRASNRRSHALPGAGVSTQLSRRITRGFPTHGAKVHASGAFGYLAACGCGLRETMASVIFINPSAIRTTAMIHTENAAACVANPA